MSESLRAEASGWAIEWAKAMDQENFNRYQAACDHVRSSASRWDRIRDSVFGEDDLPDQPSPAAVPTSPRFLPTRRFANYSSV